MKSSGPIKRKTPLKRSTTPIRKVNPTAKAKRVAKQKKHYASAEYKAARKAQILVAGGRCEAWHLYDGGNGYSVQTLIPGDPDYPPSHIAHMTSRCVMREKLEFHELDYGSDLGLIRPIRGVILCKVDHSYIEKTRHQTRHQRR